VAIDQDRGSGQEAGIHAHAVAGVDLQYNETLPVIAASFGLGAEAAQEILFKLVNLFHVHAHDQRLGRGHCAIDLEDVFEFVIAGRQDAGTFVDFLGIQQVEDGEMLNSQDLVHALETQAPLAVKEVGNVGLFESGLLGQAQAG